MIKYPIVGVKKMKKIKVLKESPIEYELHYNERMERFGSFILAGLMTLSLIAPSTRKGNKRANSEDLKIEELTISFPIDEMVKARNGVEPEESKENSIFGLYNNIEFGVIRFIKSLSESYLKINLRAAEEIAKSGEAVLEMSESGESITDESMLEEPTSEENTDEPNDAIAPASEPTNTIPVSSVPLTFNQDLTISNEEKIAWILQHWNLTYDEFIIVISTCCHEGGPNYVEGYAVINNVFNRINSYTWASKENQRNLYYQIVRSGQYSSYYNGHYKEYLNATPETCPAFQAMIDFLYQEKPTVLHNYLGFRSHGSNKFTTDGNGYRDPQTEDDYISTDLNHITLEQLQEIAAVGGFANYFTQAEVIEELDSEETIDDTTNPEDTIDTPEETVTPDENLEQPSEGGETDLETPFMDSYPELSYPRRVRVRTRS